MVFRLAAVSFLNMIPLIDWFEQTGDDRVAPSRALPSPLAGLWPSGRAQFPVVRNNLQRC